MLLRVIRLERSAFAIGDASYLRQTWHPGTAPDDLDLDLGQRWTRLEIVAVEEGVVDGVRGVVEFRAHWRHGSEQGVLHERSRFIRQSERWWYLDGRVSSR